MQQDDPSLVDYLFDELSEEEAQAFEQQLDAYADLDGEVSSLAETLDAMRALPAEEPPDWLAAKVLAEARQTAEAVEAERWPRKLSRWLWGSGGLVGAGAVAVLLAVVGAPMMLSESSSPDQESFRLAQRELEGAPVAAAPEPAVAEPKAEAEAERAEDVDTDALDFGAAPEAEPSLGDVASKAAPTEQAGRSAGSGAPKRKAKKRASAPRRSRRQFQDTSEVLLEKSDRGGGGPAAGAIAPAKATTAKPAAKAPAAPRPARRAPRAAAEAPASAPPRPDPAPEPPHQDFEDDLARPADKAEKKKEADPEQSADFWLAAAREEIIRGDLRAARRAYQRGAARLEGSPQLGRIHVARAELELRVGDLAAARRYARAALAFSDVRDRARSLLIEIDRRTAPAPAAPATESR